jgi:hypothetical protein
VKLQLAPSSHVQSPFAQTPEHDEPEPQSTWQGGASHVRLHCALASQTQVPFEQSAWTPLHATSMTRRINAGKRRRGMALWRLSCWCFDRVRSRSRVRPMHAKAACDATPRS